MTTAGSYSLEVDFVSTVTGPLALVAPQAVEAGRRPGASVRILDDHGRAARIRQYESNVSVQWDPPNELFPADASSPAWIERLQSIIDQL